MAKASLDLFSLGLKQFWTFSDSGDRIYKMKKSDRVRTAGHQNREIIFAVLRSLVNPAPTGDRTQKTLGQCMVPLSSPSTLSRGY